MHNLLAARYQQAIQQQGFVMDSAQQDAVQLLDACLMQLVAGKAVQGVYLWGPVGRGKTWLMDQFYQLASVPKKRQHFHHFMRWVHQRMFQLTGVADPLQRISQELAEQIKLLCFDELFISDIADAVILGGLFQALFAQGIVIVCTSNNPPDQLYADGFNRERLLPAIAAIQQQMQVVALDGGQDHRLHVAEAVQRYFLTEQRADFWQAFQSYSGAGQIKQSTSLQLGQRQVASLAASEQAACFSFQQLCEQPLSALEFIALCDQFQALFVDQLPCLTALQKPSKIARGTEDAAQRVVAGDRQLPALSKFDDSVRRFIALVDECYDRQIPLYLCAAVPLSELYTAGYLDFPFRRTLSRLQEMQTVRFARDSAALD